MSFYKTEFGERPRLKTAIETDPNFEGPIEYMQNVLEFCACGAPEDSLRYIAAGLRLLFEKVDQQPNETWSEACARLDAKCRQFFGTTEAEWFFRYWADKDGWTEHGGGVGACWETTHGLALIEDIELALKLEELADE